MGTKQRIDELLTNFLAEQEDLIKYEGMTDAAISERLLQHKPRGGLKLSPLEADTVNRPPHYTSGSIECIDAIAAATEGLVGIEAVCVSQVLKYTWRYKRKNGVEDLRKARWYLTKLIETLEK